MPACFESADSSRSQGVFETRAAALKAERSDPEFRDLLRAYLGKGYRLVEFRVAKPVQVMPDLVPHYNPSFDTHVHSRRQLDKLMKETDSVPYEPSAKQKERDAYARDRMKFEASRR